MEVTFTSFKQKDVVNLLDGKNLGRVCDITFSSPENRVLGLTVTGCKGFHFTKQEIFLPIQTVVKIGDDAVLVKFGKSEPPADKPPQKPCPPNDCPPPCPPNNCPPPHSNHGGDRRSYDEYE